MPHPHRRLLRSRLLPVLTVALGAGLLLSGCGGGGDEAAQKSPRTVLSEAKQKFDDAASVHIALSTASTPQEGNGVLGADGTITQAPAFRGDVKVVLSGLTATVPITSVGGKVFAKLPLQTRYSQIKPGEYGAPDPADFADPDQGLSSLLTQLQGVKKKSETRNADQILTTYSGTLPGAAVKKIIPSAVASETYATTVGVDDKGFASTVKVKGPFFSGGGDVTYDLALDGYGKKVTITPPAA